MSPGARRRRAAKRRRKGKTREARRISASDATIRLMVEASPAWSHELWLRSGVAGAPFFKQVPPRHAMSGSFAFRSLVVVDEYSDPIWFTTRPDFAGIDRGVMPSRLELFTHKPPSNGHDDVVDAAMYALARSER